jgi:hypothetical protein
MPRRKIRPNLDVDITWDDVSNKPSLITGSGATNTIPKFTGTNTIGNSVIYENNDNVGIGTTIPSEKLNIVGNILFQASSTSLGFMVGDRASDAGKQLFFQGVEGSYSVFNVSTKNATAANRKVSQISFWAVDINGSDIQNEVQFALQRPADIGSGVIFTQGFGTGVNNAGDIYIEPKWNQNMESLGKFVVKQSGNVGIGTTTPEAKLHIYDSSSGEIRLEGANKARFLAHSGGAFWIQAGSTWAENSTADIHFSGIFGSPIHMTIQGNTGNVGIGTTSPEAKLAIIGGVNIGGTTDPGYGNLYVENNCSADSFTDRTKGYNGDALSEIKRIKNKDGEIDHDTLPEFVKKEIKLTSEKGEYGRKVKEVTVEQGRDIGAMVTMLTVAIQQIADRLEKLEAKIK